MKISAGLLMYRIKNKQLEVFLAHPGGPFFKKKDEGFWTIPKGIVEKNEDLLDAAKREFKEETGLKPEGPFVELGNIEQKNNKTVHAWGFKGDIKEGYSVQSNMCTTEWPPKSGKLIEYPEMDRAEFFNMDQAKKKIMERQWPLVERLNKHLKNIDGKPK